MPRNKKIFIITFIVVIVALLGFYLYKHKTGTSNTINNNGSNSQQFNPFGSNNTANNNTGGNTNTTGQGTSNETGATSRLKKITSFAIAGAAFLEDTRVSKTVDGSTGGATSTNDTVPALRYIERATGHIYERYLDTDVEGKISNSTIPAVYETIFGNKASSVIYRYPSDDGKSITSFLAELGGSSNFLSDNILGVALSPDKTKFFSIIQNSKGVVGTIKSFVDNKSSQVFVSPFSEWLPQWVTNGDIFLTTKPSYLVNGDVFDLNISSGTLNKVFGDVPGLTTLANNNGTLLLYGASLNNGPTLNIYDIKNNKSTSLGYFGLPEKCIWSNDNTNIYCAVPNKITTNQIPDYWYQGLVSFDDSFVEINTQTGNSATLANSSDNIAVDATNFFWDDKENTLFFINKKDGTLWSLQVN